MSNSVMSQFGNLMKTNQGSSFIAGMVISWLLVIAGKVMFSRYALMAFVLAVVYIRVPTATRRTINAVFTNLMQRVFTAIFGAASPQQLWRKVSTAAQQALQEVREDYEDAPNRDQAWFNQSDEDYQHSHEIINEISVSLKSGASRIAQKASETVHSVPARIRGNNLPRVVICEQVTLPPEVAMAPIASDANPLLNDPLVVASTSDKSTKKEIARKSAELEDIRRRMMDKITAHFRNFWASLPQKWRRLLQGLNRCTTYVRAVAAGLPTTSVAQRITFPCRLGYRLIKTLMIETFVWCLILFWILITKSLHLTMSSARWIICRQPTLSSILIVVLYNSWQVHRIIVRSARSISLNKTLIILLLNLMVLRELYAKLSQTSWSRHLLGYLKKN